MQRLSVTPRADWRAHVEGDLGFAFHTIDGAPYWDETACYRLTAAEVDEIEDATQELEQMALGLVDRVVDTGEQAFERLRIPRVAWEAIAASWHSKEKNLYGRMDLAYRGDGPPKLLEYNADTPTALFEAAVVQWDWLQATSPERDQFNSIHERLIEAWTKFGIRAKRVHFAAVRDHAEDNGTIEYLRDTATQARLETARIAIEDIGWDGARFVDLDEAPVAALFKLYPWEWLVREEFGQHLLGRPAALIEPAWKMLLSNKALLVLLWEMNYGHPNLLPAYFTPERFGADYVRKPLLSREGANVMIRSRGVVRQQPGGYGEEGFVYQGVAPLPAFEGRYPVIGSWIVGDQPAGIGIREDDSPITRNSSRFLPHYFT